MERFGYLSAGPSNVGALHSQAAVAEAIKRVQKFGGIAETGVLDDETKAVS